jgi:putative nucleotidyltransferase with HDIG domain
MNKNSLKKFGASFLESLLRGEKISYKFYHPSEETNDLLFNLIISGLSRLHLDFLNEIIVTYVQEIINNALKANLKRIYFKQNRQDINNEVQYQKLIQSFKPKVLLKMENYYSSLKQEELYIKIGLKLSANSLAIEIYNNVSLLPVELKRINERLDKIKKVDNILNLMVDVSDKTEGAGIGLVLLIKALEKTGIGTDSFSIKSQGNMTYTKLIIPSNLNQPRTIKKILTIFSQQLKKIPAFADDMRKILDLCQDKSLALENLTALIEEQKALVPRLKKIMTPFFYPRSRKEKNLRSIMLRTDRESLRDYILALAALDTIQDHIQAYNGYWQHAIQCAIYSASLARYFKSPELISKSFLGGLLHDIGKLLIYAIKPDIVEEVNNLRLDNIRKNKSFLEELSLGISHTKIGLQIAEKWALPEVIKESIHLHHCPILTANKYSLAVSIIHLADAFINVERRKGKYYLINKKAMAVLNITRESDLARLHKRLKNDYLSIKSIIGLDVY